MLAILMFGLALVLPAQDAQSLAPGQLATACYHGNSDSCDAVLAHPEQKNDRAYALLAKGMMQARAQSFGTATSTMKQGLALVPRDPQAHALYGWVLEKSGSSADAEYAQAMSLDLAKDGAIEWSSTATALIDNIAGRGDFSYEAGKGFERIDKKYIAKAFYLEAAAAFERMASPSVMDAYNGALRMDSSDADIHDRIALFLGGENRERTDDIIHQLEQAVLLAPNDPTYHYELAQKYLATGQSEKAIEQLDLTASLKPNAQPARNDFRIVFTTDGDAVAEASDFDSSQALEQLRGCVAGEGLRGEVACRRALKIGLSAANSAKAHTFLAQHLSGENAAAEYRAAIAADPNNALAYLKFGEAVVASNGKIKEDAVALFTTAARLRPEWVAPREHLADVLWSHKQFDEAITAQRDAANLDPKDERLTTELRERQVELESYHTDLKRSAAAAQGKPRDAESEILLADALNEMGRLDEARNAYREAYKLDPKVGWNMASNILYHGFADVACEILPRVSVSDDPSRPVASLESDLEACAEMFAQDTAALTRLAKLQMNDGNPAGAISTFREIVNRDSAFFEEHPEERALYDRAKTLKRP